MCLHLNQGKSTGEANLAIVHLQESLTSVPWHMWVKLKYLLEMSPRTTGRKLQWARGADKKDFTDPSVSHCGWVSVEPSVTALPRALQCSTSNTSVQDKEQHKYERKRMKLKTLYLNTLNCITYKSAKLST